MSYPWLLYENIMASGTLTEASEMSASGLVSENAVDWKPYVTHWTPSGVSGIHTLSVDLGTGVTSQPDTMCFIDHNLKTATSGTGTYRLLYSDNGSSYTQAFAAVTPTDDRLKYKQFTLAGGHRYYRVEFSGVFHTYFRLGQVTVGRRLTFTEGLQPGFDLDREQALQSSPISEAGVFLGADVRRIRKQYNLQWDGTPGFSETFFVSGTVLSMSTFWKEHAGRLAKPFFFSWDDAKADPEFCRIQPEFTYTAPFGPTYLRRGLNLSFDVFVESV
jgi:hypothetical protein